MRSASFAAAVRISGPFASSTSWSQWRSDEDRISSSQKYTGTPAG